MDDSYTPSPSEPTQVLLVDDERFVHDLVKEALKDDCVLMSAEDSAEALMIIEAQTPELILLDVELPGMDGLDLCKRLRDLPAIKKTPIIFLSAHDEITDRIAGYDAGADDYVIKPFSMRELRAKVLSMLSKAQQHRALEDSAEFASSTAMTALSSMGEIGVLLEALKKFNAAHLFAQIAATLIEALSQYSLQGVTQVRAKNQNISCNMHGEASPIEIAIIEKMIGMDRIFQFGNRLIITYEHVSLLVSNLPADDPERVGRLRDHLAMLAEGANVRVQAILAEAEAKTQGDVIQQTLARITETLKELDIAQRNSQVRTNIAVSQMSEEIGRALLSVALTEEQEDYLTTVIHRGVEHILDINSSQSNLQNKLSAIIHDLRLTAGSVGASPNSIRLSWSDLFSVNHPMIDDDHKTLIMKVNRIYEAIELKNKELITKSFTQLLDHTREHFAREEELMKQSAYPGLAAHATEHEKLLKELEAQEATLLTHKGLRIESFNVLKDWTVEHIINYDRLLGAYLAKRLKAA
ncbi:bacteriohemerythrin [Uliginosibacterium gangwonense]|uniref:bacteriohemerythrin n=1 Tax=Uliginosibacterium gangwonense TaxID=392736 RepID=UPI0003769553|nr:bacteriohemerythrin [Uliginosibacterium gangwonense]